MPLVGPGEDPVKVKIERVLVSQQEGVVILAPENGEWNGRVLPVFIDLGQAMNIQVSLEGRMVGRPLTHDLFTTVLNEMSAIVDRVVIQEIAQNTFFANLVLELEKKGKRDKVTFDARPSDCLALAVRAGAPIYVRREVLETAAVDKDKLFGETPTTQQGIEFESDPDSDEDEDEDDEPDSGGGPPPERLDPGDLERP
jgi:uncharacterized protein